MDASSNTYLKKPAFKIVIFCLIATGILFRFHNLEGQSFWHDESITALAMSGHTKWELNMFLFEQPRQVSELVEFGKPVAGRFPKVWTALSKDQPEHAPLFYTLEYFWASTLGGDVRTMRLLPALLSLLQLPAFYWLGRQLFQSREVAWIMTALVAVSPSAVTYAQEVREYSLYTATIALFSAAFLQVCNSPTRRNWILYGAMLLFSTFSSMLTLFVWFAQLSLLILQKQSKRVVPFLVTGGVCLAFFSPWLLIHLPHATSGYKPLYWMSEGSFSYSEWLACLMTNFSLPFVLPSILPKQLELFVVGTYVAIVTYSIFRTARSAPLLCRNYLFLMILDSAAPLISTDIVFGGIRSVSFKYFSPVHVSMIACLAFAISFHVLRPATLRIRFAHVLFLLSLIAALIRSDMVWTNMHTSFLRSISSGVNIYAIGQILNRDYKAPAMVKGVWQPTTLVSDLGSSFNNDLHLMALTRELNPNVRILHYRRFEPSELPAGLLRFFYLNPKKENINSLRQNGYKARKLQPMLNLWLVTRVN